MAELIKRFALLSMMQIYDITSRKRQHLFKMGDTIQPSNV